MIGDPHSLIDPIVRIYEEIELRLLKEIASRFDTYETIGGSLEWQLKKLDEMGALNGEAVRIIASYSKKSESEIQKMLRAAGFANIDLPFLQSAYENSYIPLNPTVLMESVVFRSTFEDSYRELSSAFKMINTSALESVKQEYMTVLNTAYIEVSSGVYDYNTAIRRGLLRMAEKGITGATYQRGGKTIHYSIEAAVRRDTLTAVHQAANRNSCKLVEELGAEYVEVSSHAGARTHPTNPIANHAHWQGKVYKLEGSDENHANLKESTGYPDDIRGLGGVNCRHRIYPFFPGLSAPVATQYDEKEADRIYKLTQQQRAMERGIRALKKKIAVLEGAKQPTKELRDELRKRQTEIAQFTRENNLRRDWNREAVQAEL